MRATNATNAWGKWMFFALPALFLLLFYFYPLGKIFILSFIHQGSLKTDKLYQLISNPIYFKILWFTIWQAFLSTVITVFFALPGAYIFSKFRFAGKEFLQALMVVPFIMPTVVTAAAFRALLGENGLVNSWYWNFTGTQQPLLHIDNTVTFFLLAHLFYNYTLVVKIVGSYWEGIDTKLVAAAKTLGASPWTAFRTITLPLLLPALSAASLLVFIFCFTSFGVILILGGARFATLEVEIYRQTVQMFNLPMAATLSLTQIIFNFFLMWLHAKVSAKSRVSFFTSGSSTAQKPAKTLVEKLFLYFNLAFISLLLLSPLLALVLRSITGETGFTLSYYIALFAANSDALFFVEPIAAVKNSVGFAVASMVIALTLGLLASTFLASNRNKTTALWDAIIMLPLATSAVTLGFGYIITLNKPPLNLRDSLALVPIAHSLVAFPFVVRCILPSLRRIPKSLREAGWLLGGCPFSVWYLIELAIIRKALLVAALFAFCISMGEFGASAFVVRPHTPTMPVAIFRFLSQPGEMNYGQAMAMSSLLMLVTCSSFWFINKFENNPFLTQRDSVKRSKQ